MASTRAEYMKQWAQNNTDKVSKKWNKWHSKNKKSVIARHKERRETEPLFVLTDNLRRRVRHFINGTSNAEFSRNLLGIDREGYKKHIEKKFKPGMTWDNYGEWVIDHIKPLSAFNLFDYDEQIKAFNYKNTQPLWRVENGKKSNKY